MLLYLSDVEDSELAIKGCGGPGHPTSHYPAETFAKGRERLALAEACSSRLSRLLVFQVRTGGAPGTCPT